jgi:hypothetical protein
MNADVTVVINVYKRVWNLQGQIQSLLNQTKKIDKYIFCVNNRDVAEQYYPIIADNIPREDYLIVEHSQNLGVWSRFFLAYNAKTEFIFIIDDDIICWPWYIENCYECFKKKPWIYWSWGSIFNSLKVRQDRKIISESDNIPSKITLCNMSGHSWFFPKSYLPYMFCSLPEYPCDKMWEELRISRMASMHNIKTYIPPMNNKHITWNLQPKLWLDKVANYNAEKDNYQLFYEYCVHCWYNPIEDYKKLSSKDK